MRYYIPREGKFSLVLSNDPLDESGYTEVSLPLDSGDPNLNYIDAYEVRDGRFFVNMQKARAKCLEIIRGKRDSFLKELDSIQFRAVCSGDTDEVKRIESRKQELRDVPDSINWEAIDNLYDMNHISPPKLGHVAI